MKTFRALTLGEIALAAALFGPALDTSRIRLLAFPLWPRAFVAGPALIVWPARDLPADFATAPLTDQAVFIHELTHVWQAQSGVFLPFAKLRAGDGAASYAYDEAALADFAALNIEQQAMAVQHAFLAFRGGQTPYPAQAYARIAAVLTRV